MANIVTCECFKGFHSIASNCYSKETLQCYIEQFESEFINKLLGCELATELCLYIDGRKNNPTNTIINDNFELIINGFCKKTNSNSCGCGNICESQSKGLKWVLTGFIYYKYMSVEPYTSTTRGPVRVQSSNSVMISNLNLRRIADMRHNNALISYKAIQSCIKTANSICGTDPIPYPNYNGCDIHPVLTDIL